MVKGCFTNAGQFQVVMVPKWAITIRLCWRPPGSAAADKEQAKKARAPEYEVA